MKKHKKTLLNYSKWALIVLAIWSAFNLLRYYAIKILEHFNINSEPTQYITIIVITLLVLVIVYKYTPEKATKKILGGGK